MCVTISVVNLVMRWNVIEKKTTTVNDKSEQKKMLKWITIYGCIKMSEPPSRSRSSTPSKESKKPPTVPPPVGFNAKLFKKCKSATFQIDGQTYTIGKW